MYLSIYPSINPSTYLSIHTSIHPSIHTYIYLLRENGHHRLGRTHSPLASTSAASASATRRPCDAVRGGPSARRARSARMARSARWSRTSPKGLKKRREPAQGPMAIMWSHDAFTGQPAAMESSIDHLESLTRGMFSCIM